MGLVAHYKLDGNANDAFGKYNGTASNVTWVDGKLGQAGSFNGSARVNTTTWLDNIKSGMSWSAWVYKTSNLNSYNMFMGQYLPYFAFMSTGTFYFSPHINGTQYVIQSPTTYPLNTWHHAVATYDGTTVKLYVNGVLQAQSVLPGTLTTNTGDTFGIGDGRGNASWYPFVGLIDDVRIYDHALSEREVRDLSLGKLLHYSFDQDSGLLARDSSGQGNDGIVVGATWVEGGMVGKGCYDFTASSNKVVFNDNKTNYQNGFTISAWVFKRSNGGGAYGRVFDKSINTDATNGFYLYVNAGATYAFRVGDTTPAISTPSLNLNQWYLLTATVDSGNVARLYVDDVQVSSANNHNLALITTNNPLTIGNRSNATDRNFDGQIDDVRIYATALTADQVKEIYQQRASLDSRGNLLC